MPGLAAFPGLLLLHWFVFCCRFGRSQLAILVQGRLVVAASGVVRAEGAHG
ncbi:hypothetical protein ERO13_D12G162401v2 [Gossypium hirsutum]|nr:hypothetical protein ERO13_D12G162401v2 [Gossypium hirsutum]